ncbi:MAG TPA: sugar phosphate nucleotidyltransferase [bacterium]|nr:sugar phosphate nucleotidyltransferase [bacterium]
MTRRIQQAVIMAGGLGTRLAPLTKVIPKPLLPVGERSVLEIQLQHLHACGVREVFLALGYKAGLFEAYFGDGKKYGLVLHYSHEEKPLGTAGPLRLLRGRLHGQFLLVNGDILTNFDYRKLLRFHARQRAEFTIATKQVTLPLHYGVVKHLHGRVREIVEKPSLSAEVNAGIYAVDAGVLDLLPARGAYAMDKLIARLLRDRRRVFRFPLDAYWLDIGQLEDYHRAQQLFVS